MKKILLSTVTLLATLVTFGQELKFAWLSDVHLNSFAYAQADLQGAIEDINSDPLIEFVIFSGDLTEFGDTYEFRMLDSLLKVLKRPYLMTTGNHDVNWSENGCTSYDKIFGPPHFICDIKGIRFIGCGSGPSLRMGPPQIPREELVWLDSVINATSKEQPIIFVNHFPLDDNLSNVAELYNILAKREIKAILSGHLHVNRAYDVAGMAGVIGRSSLRRSDPAGGYNIVTLKNDTLYFNERIIKQETRPVWHKVAINSGNEHDSEWKEIDYSVNDEYNHVKEEWKIKDIADIASQGCLSGNIYLYTNTAGSLHALNAESGEHLWEFKSGNKIFSAPYVYNKTVYITSCDGHIYAINLKTGEQLWSYNTSYPIVASPLVADGYLYVGSSNGKFYALEAESGNLVWECRGLTGYIEARPAVDSKNVYIGTWGAKFYAISRATGEIVWEFDTGRGRYFSPGACWPQVAENGQVLVLSSDYFLRAFNPDGGDIIWETKEANGRESLGYSANNKTVYIKGINNMVTAADISTGEYITLWECPMPYESDFVPTRLESTKSLLFIPTAFGTLHAVDILGNGVVWSHKAAHSAITSVQTVGKKRVIITTMDGTITCLSY